MNPETTKRARQIMARMPAEGNRALTVNDIAEFLSVGPGTVQTWLGNSIDHLDFARRGYP